MLGVPGNDYAPLHAAAAQTAYEDANFDACIQYSYRYALIVHSDYRTRLERFLVD